MQCFQVVYKYMCTIMEYPTSCSYFLCMPQHISYRISRQKLFKYQGNLSCFILSVILITTLSFKVLLLQGEIWCWSSLEFKGLGSVYVEKIQVISGYITRKLCITILFLVIENTQYIIRSALIFQQVHVWLWLVVEICTCRVWYLGGTIHTVYIVEATLVKDLNSRQKGMMR